MPPKLGGFLRENLSPESPGDRPWAEIGQGEALQDGGGAENAPATPRGGAAAVHHPTHLYDGNSDAVAVVDPIVALDAPVRPGPERPVVSMAHEPERDAPAAGDGATYYIRDRERLSAPESPVLSGEGRGSSLPCPLKSHNCNENRTSPLIPKGIPSAKRTAFALRMNVTALCNTVGLERVGFLTLTFADHVLEPKEAQRRLHSLTTAVLKPRYGRVIRIYERQKSGRIHYHLLIALDGDIRTGVDFKAFEAMDYRSAPARLRAEWAFWRVTAKKFGFGRTELLPVRSTSDAVGKYVGKYIGKHIDSRERRDRGVRLVSYSGPRVASTHFAWASGNAKEFRGKLRAFVTMMHRWTLIEQPSMAAMAKQYGPRWCHHWRELIFATEVEE